jgi:16S rRNA (uracil1498-N3)-methyltransferase
MAALPMFFHDANLHKGTEIWPGEDTARHVVQVLRMQTGEQIQLTDGKGHKATATITAVQKKKFSVVIDTVEVFPKTPSPLHMAVAFTKNASRNEWMLEKMTEMGISTIIPLMATRTEREKIRYDRWNNILVSALLQSQQFHLPILKEALAFKDALKQYESLPQKLLAHCIDEKPRQLIRTALQPHKETIIFIGPEGDFTADEVALCESQGFAGVSMSNNRLRTETAAMAACAYFNLLNHD